MINDLNPKNISIGFLEYKFPGFLWYARCHELVGFNPVKREWICIEDGVCVGYEYPDDPDSSYTWVYWHYILCDGVDPIELFKKERAWLGDDEGVCIEEKNEKFVW